MSEIAMSYHLRFVLMISLLTTEVYKILVVCKKVSVSATPRSHKKIAELPTNRLEELMVLELRRLNRFIDCSVNRFGDVLQKPQ